MNPNQKSLSKKLIEARTDSTKNYESGLAYEMSDKLKLYSMVSSWLVGEPKFYKEVDEKNNVVSENQDHIIIELIQKIAQHEPEFVLKLASYCKNKLYLRTAPLVLLSEVAISDKGKSKSYVRQYTPAIIKRADELATIIAYLQSRIGHIGSQAKTGSMPSSLKKGIADAFGKFNEYSLAKYNNLRRSVKLKDVIKLTHPKPKDEEQSALWNRLIKNELKTPSTWETIISSKGSNKESWTEAVKVMPYMATLRNLRNLIQNKVELSTVVEKLTNPNEIKKSKQFPFRFFSAYREIEKLPSDYNVTTILDSIEEALETSTANIPTLKGDTFISADNSGSMQSPLSERSSVTYNDVANLMMAISSRICDRVICSVFAEGFTTIKQPRTNGILANMQVANNAHVGYSTNAYLVLQYMIENKIKADRIILFSDMQCYDSYGYGNSLHEQLLEYRKRVNPNTYLYSIDLAGYGTLQIPEDDPKTCLIAGWSDKLLNYIPIFEQDAQTALDEIEKINATTFNNAR